MKRPEQHRTDSRGQALLLSALARTGWVARPLNPDYGLDYEVEVFEDNLATGITFKLQLKSSLAPSYSAGGDFVSISLEVPRARYLVIETQVPTLLVQADVELIRDPDTRVAAQTYLDRVDGAVDYLPHTQIEGSAKQIYENLATGLGIDVTDLQDARARWVRLAIDDLDPTRVLKHCEYTFVNHPASAVGEELAGV